MAGQGRVTLGQHRPDKARQDSALRPQSSPTPRSVSQAARQCQHRSTAAAPAEHQGSGVPRGHILHPALISLLLLLSPPGTTGQRGGAAASPVPVPPCERKEEAAAAATPVGGGAAGAAGPARGGGSCPGEAQPAAGKQRAAAAAAVVTSPRCRWGSPRSLGGCGGFHPPRRARARYRGARTAAEQPPASSVISPRCHQRPALLFKLF